MSASLQIPATTKDREKVKMARFITHFFAFNFWQVAFLSKAPDGILASERRSEACGNKNDCRFEERLCVECGGYRWTMRLRRDGLPWKGGDCSGENEEESRSPSEEGQVYEKKGHVSTYIASDDCSRLTTGLSTRQGKTLYYGHKAIELFINQHLFSSPKSFGSCHPEDFNPMPLPVIALACTAVCYNTMPAGEY